MQTGPTGESHIVQKFESAFYSNPDLRNVKPPLEQDKAQPTID